MNFISAITGLLGALIAVLRSQNVDKAVIDTMNVLVTALEHSDDLAEDLEELTAKVREMAEAPRSPTPDEYEALQDRAKNAMAAIEAKAAMRLSKKS